MSDRSLEQAVMAALADNAVVHPDEIAVRAAGELVTLRGTVGSLVQREEAVHTARNVPGVLSVEDDLRVRPLGYDRHVDADTEAAVLAALIGDDDVPSTGIDVDVDDDAVTLRGVVDLPAQREQAVRVARGVGGVKRVENRLRVRGTPHPTTGGTIMTLSDQLASLSTRAKQAEDRAAAVNSKTKTDLESDVTAARASAQAKARKLGDTAEEKKGRISDRWSDVQKTWNEHVQTFRADIDRKKAEHDLADARQSADDAEDDALYAIDYAYAAVEEAEYAVLDAELAAMNADELEAAQTTA